MSAIFDLEKLEHLAGEGWLRRQRHPEADLWIYNYTEKTQYEGHWTPETLACRGLILDADGGIVARPFPKFFNYGDPLTGELPDEPFMVSEKIDGSLGILYLLDGVPQIATRDSFISEQAIEGTRMLDDYQFVFPPHVTALFEIVFPSNRIVVDYGDRRELVLLAALDKATAVDLDLAPPIAWTGEVARRHFADGLDQLAAQNRPNAEGYVVRFKSGLRVKVKHEDYKRLHRIITGVNARHIWEALKAGQDPTTELEGVPDEIFGWIEETVVTLKAKAQMVEAEAREAVDSRPLGDDRTNRKAIAEHILESGANSAVCFRMLDGKPYRDLVWKAIRPEPTTPDTVWNAEIAA